VGFYNGLFVANLQERDTLLITMAIFIFFFVMIYLYSSCFTHFSN